MLNPYLDSLSCWKTKNRFVLVQPLTTTAWKQPCVKHGYRRCRFNLFDKTKHKPGKWNIFRFETRENKNKASKWIIAACSEEWSPRGKQCMQKWDIIHINTELTGFTRVKPLRWAWLIFQNRQLSCKRLQHKDDIMTSEAKYLVSDGSTADLRQQTDSTLSWQLVAMTGVV